MQNHLQQARFPLACIKGYPAVAPLVPVLLLVQGEAEPVLPVLGCLFRHIHAAGHIPGTRHAARGRALSCSPQT